MPTHHTFIEGDLQLRGHPKQNKTKASGRASINSYQFDAHQLYKHEPIRIYACLMLTSCHRCLSYSLELSRCV